MASALLGYARTHSRLAIVVTLAGQADAFAGQTRRLSQLLAQVRGGDLPAAEVQAIADQATHDALSVISRDASAVTPVQSGELSHVLGRRLFERIDAQAADEAANAWSRKSWAVPAISTCARPWKPTSAASAAPNSAPA